MSDINIPKITRRELIERYCERQAISEQDLTDRMNGMAAMAVSRAAEFHGWFLAECQMLDSSRLGSLVILPFGPHNTFKRPPQSPFSPRGLASDMSMCIAWTDEV